MKKEQKITAKEFALAAGQIAIERNCKNVCVLDLTGKSPATDFFLIATGTSDRQMRTVAEEIEDYAKENKYMRFGVAGKETAKWILLDYVDVMIHVMNEEARDYYNLEMLWGDAEKIELN